MKQDNYFGLNLTILSTDRNMSDKYMFKHIEEVTIFNFYQQLCHK